MKKMRNGLTTLLAILIVLTAGGFYFVLSNIGELRTELKNMELALEIVSKKNEPAEVKEITEEAPTPPSPSIDPNVTIPTSIIALSDSSPVLQPQTRLTIAIESVKKRLDGTVEVNIKVFTSETASYSAFEPRDFFQVISLTGENQRPIETRGQFSSMPPRNSVTGSVSFKIDPAQRTLILQVGTDQSAKYYEFNFDRKTYKETVIG